MDYSCLPYFLGEIFELKAELNSDKKEKKKEAVKKVIYRTINFKLLSNTGHVNLLWKYSFYLNRVLAETKKFP